MATSTLSMYGWRYDIGPLPCAQCAAMWLVTMALPIWFSCFRCITRASLVDRSDCISALYRFANWLASRAKERASASNWSFVWLSTNWLIFPSASWSWDSPKGFELVGTFSVHILVCSTVNRGSLTSLNTFKSSWKSLGMLRHLEINDLRTIWT